MQEFESGLENIGLLADWYKVNEAARNEATTRLQLIDRLLFECLGWQRDHVHSEESHEGQYADYTLQFPRKLLIVEAKREGTYFELPVGHTRLDYSIPALFRTTPALKAAMEQVAEYCQNRGVPYSAVTNGHQLVLFLGNRNDGTPPFEGTAIVFSSLEHMRKEFLQLWNLASPAAIEQHLLRNRLIGEARPNLPPKLSALIKPYPGTKGRNPFQSSMKVVSEFILEDLAKIRALEGTFLKACYCYSGQLSQYSLASRQMLRARYAALFDDERPGPAVSPASEAGEINPELLGQGLSRRPVLLIGDVGVGKTTFIRNLIKNDEVWFADTAIAIYIDFGTTGTLASDLRGYILSEIDRQLAEDYKIDIQADELVREAFSYELGRFAKGVNASLKLKKPDLFAQKEIEYLETICKNREEHLRRVIDLVSYREKRQIIVFLDNTDQRSEEDQQATFLIAEEMAERWQAVIYVTLRPETYHSSLRRGALTGYHPKAFTIAPPRIDRVIKKRLYFGLRVTSGKFAIDEVVKTAQLDFTSLDVLIRVFLRSMRDETIKCIENIAAGNVRLALELVRSFFGSGHVDTQKIIAKVREGGYLIPLHEFQRAIIYGDNVHYDPTRSPIANLFDVSSLDPREHFLQPLLLAYLRVPALDGPNEGFVSVRFLYDQLQPLGFVPEQIDVGVARVFGKRLVETAARRIPEPGKNDDCSLRLTTVGLYHLQELVSTFTYLDAVIVDTPILDKDLRAMVIEAHTLQERLERCTIFCAYLDKCWGAIPVNSLPFDWPATSKAVKRLLEKINRRVQEDQRFLEF